MSLHEKELMAAWTERDFWIRAFNRLDAAINHHERDTPPIFASDADERLWLARTKIHMHLHEGTI